MVADLHASSPTAVELVNPKHRNEWKHHMALITSYHVPGLYVEDHSIDVPLDWRGLEPMLLAVGSTMRRGAMPAPIAGAPESIKLFYRVVCAPDRINDDLPLLLFLQGGPGGESPRPLSPTSDGWIEEAVKQAGLPVEAVMETVAEYNKAVREGKTAELVPPYLNEHPHELKTGPFYLVPAVGGIANTFGGPKIDANARVVNTEDRPIPGLYAAGAAAGGIWYAADVSGSQLGGCMVFGRLAARHAAARAKKA